MFQFFAGACLGAGLALLYAPTTGRNVRARIKDKAVKAQHEAERLGDIMDKKRRHYSNVLRGVRHDLNEKRHDVAGQLEHMADDMSLKMEKAKENVSGTVTKMKERTQEKIASTQEKLARSQEKKQADHTDFTPESRREREMKAETPPPSGGPGPADSPFRSYGT